MQVLAEKSPQKTTFLPCKNSQNTATTRNSGTVFKFYRYGARYLDPRTSRWVSADPAVPDYIPQMPANDDARKRNQNLPGMGGVYNLVNLHVYHYAGNNPLKYVDPDGKWVFKLGFTANATVGGGWSVNVGIAFGHSKEDGVSIGFYITTGETKGTPAAGIGVTGTLVAKADTVRDLETIEDKSLGVSTPVPSPGIGIDISTDENYKLDPASGVSLTIGLKGSPLVEVHGSSVETKTASISAAEMAPKIKKAEQDYMDNLLDKITNPLGF